MQYRSTLSAALLVLAACAHTPATPPSFGFHGRVRPHHDVACALDEEMTEAMCDVVGVAVDKINSAVGYELLSPPRHATIAESRASKPDRETIFIGVTTLRAPVLGVTYPVLYEKETGYLRLEVVVFDASIWADPFMSASVVLHEMLHAVGAVHAAPAGPWESVMRPAWTPGAPVELTRGDLAALRAAYAL